MIIIIMVIVIIMFFCGKMEHYFIFVIGCQKWIIKKQKTLILLIQFKKILIILYII